ncbi:MAG: type II toxin-antitoxin system Phd/YefM family antitoxin [Candidatus Jacksonbacteria bacterium]
MNNVKFLPIPKTASMREVQRNYRQLFDWVEESKRPLVLTANGRSRVVVLSLDIYNMIAERTSALGQLVSNQTSNYSKKGALQAKNKIRQLAKLGDQKVSLSDFVILDRENH